MQSSEGSHSHYSIKCDSARTPVAREPDYHRDTNPSTGRSQVVEKKDTFGAGSNRMKEAELQGSVSKSDSVPEVEALLARLRAL